MLKVSTAGNSAVLTVNSKTTWKQVQREMVTRGTPDIRQLTVFNSKVNEWVQLADRPIEHIALRKCTISCFKFTISGQFLKVVELPNCGLTHLPNIRSKVLVKLNISSNLIESLPFFAQLDTLEVLDLRNNGLRTITAQVFNKPQSSFTILHQLIDQGNCQFSKESNEMIGIPTILEHTIVNWSQTRIVQTCQDIINNDNPVLFAFIAQYLDLAFIQQVATVAKQKHKCSLLRYLLSQQLTEPLCLQQKVTLLMADCLSPRQISHITMEALIESMSNNHQPPLVLEFIKSLSEICQHKNFFIQSQRDIIEYMRLSNLYNFAFELEFLLTQAQFFANYDCSNKSIIKYFLRFDSFELVAQLIQSQYFRSSVLQSGLYRKLIKPVNKTYKLLQKYDKYNRKNTENSHNLWYFPQYRQRKTFCLRNELYDYDVLSEYEEMQQSFRGKDAKQTLKFYNKENNISVAERIGKQIKRHKISQMKSRLTSTRLNSREQGQTNEGEMMKQDHSI